MREIPVVLLGFGNVGQSVARLVASHHGFEQEGVRLVLHAVFDRGGGVRAAGLEHDALIAAKRDRGSVALVSSGVSVSLTEALDVGPEAILMDTSVTDASTGEPGFGAACSALSRGMSVAFASKGPLVARFRELRALAREHGGQIGAAAAVGVPLPVLDVGLGGIRGAKLLRIRGVLNDTSNQVLRDLEAGATLPEAIASAQRAGIIEEDPSLDLDGWDAAYKLLILARTFWDESLELSALDRTGIGEIGTPELERAAGRGERIRLIATGERGNDGRVRLRTEPLALGPEDPLYDLGPGEKGFVFETELMGNIFIRTSKGGPAATAACVVKDALNLSLCREL